MNDTDLEKYKSAWKKETGFEESRLSRSDINKFMHSASKDISVQFRTGIKIDLVLKVILACLSASVALLFPKESLVILVGVLLALIAITSIVFQLKTYSRIPGNSAEKSMLTLLKDYIDFYNKKYIGSLLTAALTGPLIFICGSLYYLYLRYGGLRPFDAEDYIVLVIFVLASYILGAFSQIWNFNYRIRQLEISLAEIEQGTISVEQLVSLRCRRRRNVIIMSIFLLAGILMLLLLIFNLNN